VFVGYAIGTADMAYLHRFLRDNTISKSAPQIPCTPNAQGQFYQILTDWYLRQRNTNRHPDWRMVKSVLETYFQPVFPLLSETQQSLVKHVLSSINYGEIAKRVRNTPVITRFIP
jgi:hypothetical protein